MNDAGCFKAVSQAIHNSPAHLLQELGFEGELYLYRRGPIERCARVSLDILDDAVRNRGPALLFQIMERENLLPIIFGERHGIYHECASLLFDYTVGTFLFTFYSWTEKECYTMTPCDMRRQGFYLPVSAMKQLRSLPL